MNAITETTMAVLSPLEQLWYGLIEILPGIAGALIVGILGYFLGLILGAIVHKLLDKAGFDKALQKANVGKFVKGHSMSEICGALLKWYIFVVFLSSAVNLINLRPLSAVLDDLVRWLPNLILGVVVMIIGLIAAEFIYERISHAHKIKGVRTIALFVKMIVIVFVAIIALEQIGIRIGLAREAFLIILASFGLGVAIALGMGFGFALKNEAGKWIKELKKI